MKVIDVKSIGAGANKQVDESNLEGFIEAPLVEPIKTLVQKKIKTLSSSCNKSNVAHSGLHEAGADMLGSIFDKYHYPQRHSMGRGYAYIMVDYDSLDAENKQIFKDLYGILNRDNDEQPVRQLNKESGYTSKKLMTYAVNIGYVGDEDDGIPRKIREASILFENGKPKYDKDGEHCFYDITPLYEYADEKAERSNDVFFIKNYDFVPSTVVADRYILLRYPVNENTKVDEVTRFFSGIADKLTNNEKKKIAIFKKSQMNQGYGEIEV